MPPLELVPVVTTLALASRPVVEERGPRGAMLMFRSTGAPREAKGLWSFDRAGLEEPLAGDGWASLAGGWQLFFFFFVDILLEVFQRRWATGQRLSSSQQLVSRSRCRLGERYILRGPNGCFAPRSGVCFRCKAGGGLCFPTATGWRGGSAGRCAGQAGKRSAGRRLLFKYVGVAPGAQSLAVEPVCLNGKKSGSKVAWPLDRGQ